MFNYRTATSLPYFPYAAGSSIYHALYPFHPPISTTGDIPELLISLQSLRNHLHRVNQGVAVSQSSCGGQACIQRKLIKPDIFLPIATIRDSGIPLCKIQKSACGIDGIS